MWAASIVCFEKYTIILFYIVKSEGQNYGDLPIITCLLSRNDSQTQDLNLQMQGSFSWKT